MKYNHMRKQLFIFFLLFSGLYSYGQSSKEVLPDYSTKGSFSLRTNVIPWAMLMPNIGVEYKTSDEIGLILEGGWAHWSLNTTEKYWRMWNVAPQVRYYVGEPKYNYVGLQYTMGEYNLTGDQGKYMGGGLTLGHQFYVAKNLMVDLGLSLGYLHIYDKEKYQRIDDVDYRMSTKTSNGYWGPTGFSITFIWKIN